MSSAFPEFKSCRIERYSDRVAELVLTGPARGNAMGPDFWRELPQAVAAAEAEAELRCLIVRGEGEHFSYGLDLPGMAAEMGPMLQDGAAGRARIVAAAAAMVSGFDALASSRLPVVAAIDGWCIGAGIEMIAACDLRLASRQARFALREVKVGIVPDLGGIQRLPHLIGEGWTRELALTGDEIDAEQARSIGLVTHCFEDGEALLAVARERATSIAANPPLVTAGIKQVMNARISGPVSHGNREAATLNGMLMQSEDFAEAMQAFMQKRPPEFKGR
ncbi:enoyl-CoA hydratase-related protein [Wenzhouxiangella marina]|uniref:Enoyl-CoA hydratase n=1 Tax=Wenzhouxiangella marina TaxID=1579979 RepID=A0A0K0XSL2_9GAMM|nr:enoyl-CoA hydratase-related protein [Wenzhouxiangella marina]AKS40612.1 Enoyl-CoA hydratase [Wenzhouxiangella marina]MBB6088380.1 enoyl-CoA hydratase [Wenzhouxiangella marina]